MVIDNNKFLIITGSGRCGTSALMQFFINSKKFKHFFSDRNYKMRAGYENHNCTIANAMISKKEIFRYLKHNSEDEGIQLIKQITQNNDIVKTPTFFFYKTYCKWKKYNTKKNISVILLKRDNSENVLISAEKVNMGKDWEFFQNGNEIDGHYKENIKNLQQCGINYVVMEFPRIVYDPIYLKESLDKVGMKFTKDEIENLSNITFNSELVTVEDNALKKGGNGKL